MTPSKNQQTSRSRASKKTPISATTSEPFNLGASFQHFIRENLGLGWSMIIVICFGAWWQWEHISKLPGVESVILKMTESAIPKAIPGKFNIAIAHLEGDNDQEMERLIRESLAEFPSVTTLSFDRLIASRLSNTQDAEREGHKRARMRVQKLSGGEIWMFIAARVLIGFGVGILAMAYFPSVANKLAWPALGVGGLLLIVASRGLLRKSANDSSA